MVGDRFSSAIEVVSADCFQQRLEAMSSKPTSSCVECLRERAKHLTHLVDFKRRARKCHRGSSKRSSPIVVRLKDTIKDADWESSSSSSCSREDSSSEASSGQSTPQRQRSATVNVRQLQKKQKNFNAFLSAIEKVHMKDGCRVLAKNQFVRSAPLNNTLPSKGRSSSDCIDLICNDLHSTDSCCSVDDTSDDTTSECSSSGIESDSDSHSLGALEVDSLREFAEGCPLTRYDCPPHQCPQCLATYSQYYSADAVSSPNTDTIDSAVTVLGPGKVSVSVAQALNTHRKSRKASQSQCPTDAVLLDLTDSAIEYSVHYDCTEPPQHTPDAFYYHFYWTMFGNGAYPSPWRSPYCLPPAAFYPYAPLTPTAPLSRSHMHLSTAFSSKHPAYFPFCSWQPTSSRLWMPNGPADLKHLNASQPPQRPWIPLAHPESTQPIAIYTVMCYNVLCDKYATRQLYGYCPSWALTWDYRKKIILEEIRQYSADIISLQEVETEQFYQFFLPELKLDGYHGIFSPKSRARTMVESERKHVDGCAIFFRTSKFSLIKEHLVEFNQLAIHTAEGSADMINRVMTKDNIGLAALLETKDAIWENGAPTDNLRRPILVATCHVHWDPEFCDVKLIQTMMLMNELKNIIEETQTSLRPGSSSPDCNSIPLILCGDLNSLPESGVVEYLNTGHVDANHRDFKDLGYEECLRKLSNDQNKDIFAHIFKLAQAYSKDVMPYTNYTFDFKGIIDYVFYSRDFMRPLGLLGPLDQEWFRENKVFGCPHPQIPSDHLPLLVEFEMGSNIGGAMQQPRGSSAVGGGGKASSRR